MGRLIPLLYGGSVNFENAVGLSQMEHIDGLFIGRAAWNASEFEKIIREVLDNFCRQKDKRGMTRKPLDN